MTTRLAPIDNLAANGRRRKSVKFSPSRLTYAQNGGPPDFMRVFIGIAVENVTF
jgi:hypothetical protein